MEISYFPYMSSWRIGDDACTVFRVHMDCACCIRDWDGGERERRVIGSAVDERGVMVVDMQSTSQELETLACLHCK